jgi:hypothetical protein
MESWEGLTDEGGRELYGLAGRLGGFPGENKAWEGPQEEREGSTGRSEAWDGSTGEDEAREGPRVTTRNRDLREISPVLGVW